MKSHLDEAEVLDALASEQERCAQDLLEFMSACGVRFTTIPPRLLELLAAYGGAAVDLGRRLARATHPIPAGVAAATSPKGADPSDESVVRRTGGVAPARRTDPSDVTRKVVLLSGHGS